MDEGLKNAILVVGDMAEEQGRAGIATALRLLALPATGRMIADRERRDEPGVKSELAVTVASWCQSARSGPLTGFNIEEATVSAAIWVFLRYGESGVSQMFPHDTRPEMAIHVLDEHAEQARRAHEERARRNPGISRVLDRSSGSVGGVT